MESGQNGGEQVAVAEEYAGKEPEGDDGNAARVFLVFEKDQGEYQAKRIV